jgi:hypothetical protein
LTRSRPIYRQCNRGNNGRLASAPFPNRRLRR